ncbi:hypothetical protein [uncultured Litoreibacter sp.]|uniref:hypothetical protein n=1 Tax=uncultured Litoreibacter sp. TaxID=1392394 RepID=UPI00263280A9|nr:hypothetical protein [uncultured Litoreibacter sp.]
MAGVWLKSCLGLAASLALAACEGELAGLAGGSGAADGKPAVSKAVGQREATVTRNKVRLTAPDGFCVDPQSTRATQAQAFVVFGNCAAITGNPEEPQPYVRAITTATVTSSGLTGDGAIAPQVAKLNAFFRTADGRAALSRTRKAETVTVLDGFTERGTLFLRVKDTSPTSFDGAEDSYWRAYFDAGSSVLAISVIGFTNAPITSAEGLDTLRGFVGRNRKPIKTITADAGAKPTGG